MSIKPPKPVCTLNQAFAPDLSKSISWSLFMEHAARALTCEISNPLDRAGVDISHSPRGLSRPQVGFVHCCGLINLEGMLHTNTQSPKNRRTQTIRASRPLAVLKHIICWFLRVSIVHRKLWMSFSRCMSHSPIKIVQEHSEMSYCIERRTLKSYGLSFASTQHRFAC